MIQITPQMRIVAAAKRTKDQLLDLLVKLAREDRNVLRRLAERLSLTIIGTEGHDVKCPCVCCQSSDAARVHQDTGVFHCSSCGKSLSPFDLTKLVLRDHRQAVAVMTEPGGKGRRRPRQPLKAWQMIPLFPKVRLYLTEAWEQAEEGAVYCIERWRHAAEKTDAGWKNCNLRTQFEKIIRRAGLEPWPKPWQNLRSSRETELAEQFPVHVVSAWIGKSKPVALEHYLQVTEDHFQAAIGDSDQAAQNPAQYAPESVRKGRARKEQTPAFPEKHEGLPTYTAVHMGVTGFEPVTSTV